MRGSSAFPDTLAGWLLLIAALILASVLVGYLQKRRERALARVIQQLDFSPDENGVNQTDGFLSLPVFANSIGTSSVIRGRVATGEAVLLDCHMAAANNHGYRHTVACFKLPGRTLPAFQLCPEKIIHKLGALLGRPDVNFQEFPHFSRNYLLRGENEAALRDFFRPPVLFFMEQHPGWCVEAEGEWLAVYRVAIAPDPKRLRRFLSETTEIASVFA